MRKDEESNFDEGSQQGGKAEQPTGSRKLRRVVLDEDDEDDDDNDEGSEADDEYGEGDEEVSSKNFNEVFTSNPLDPVGLLNAMFSFNQFHFIVMSVSKNLWIIFLYSC